MCFVIHIRSIIDWELFRCIHDTESKFRSEQISLNSLPKMSYEWIWFYLQYHCTVANDKIPSGHKKPCIPWLKDNHVDQFLTTYPRVPMVPFVISFAGHWRKCNRKLYSTVAWGSDKRLATGTYTASPTRNELCDDDSALVAVAHMVSSPKERFLDVWIISLMFFLICRFIPWCHWLKCFILWFQFYRAWEEIAA